MTEKFAICDFGPIREADLEIRQLTVFVGPQATGKSLAAQILYYMRGIEALIAPHPVEPPFNARRKSSYRNPDLALGSEGPLQTILSGLEWWLGNSLSVYVTHRTSLCWSPSVEDDQCQQEVKWDKAGPRLNKALEKRLQAGTSFPPRSDVYIPAGRALYSFLPPASALRVISSSRARLKWPGYIPIFYEALGDALDQLWKEQERGRQPTLFERMVNDQFLQERLDAIFKGQIHYGPDTVSLEVKRKHFRAETLAAGQMEIWPFWVILQTSLHTGVDMARIYFEEPEAHLHPAAQRGVMDIIAYVVGQQGEFVITTHSPYILYAINNCLMAQKVIDRNHPLPAGIRKEVALKPEQVAAYRFSDDGKVSDIMDRDVGLIDEDELDRVADELGATFTQLQIAVEDGE